MAQVECGKAVSTLARRLAAISQAHQYAGEETPTQSKVVRTVMAGVRRTHGVMAKQCLPLLTAHVQAIAYSTPETRIGIRDKALILLGFSGAFRESELVELDVRDLQFDAEGVKVRLRRSKTDQNHEGRLVGIANGTVPATCPVRALRAWLDAAQITEGNVFRGMNRHNQIRGTHLAISAVDTIIKRAVARAGFDPSAYSGHSLRAGHCTTAARAGVPERIIQRTTGHRCERVLRRYIREGDIWRENSSAHLGL